MLFILLTPGLQRNQRILSFYFSTLLFHGPKWLLDLQPSCPHAKAKRDLPQMSQLSLSSLLGSFLTTFYMVNIYRVKT